MLAGHPEPHHGLLACHAVSEMVKGVEARPLPVVYYETCATRRRYVDAMKALVSDDRGKVRKIKRHVGLLHRRRKLRVTPRRIFIINTPETKYKKMTDKRAPGSTRGWRRSSPGRQPELEA